MYFTPLRKATAITAVVGLLGAAATVPAFGVATAATPPGVVNAAPPAPVALKAAAPTATKSAAKPSVADFDAELSYANQLHLSIETRSATSVKFKFDGRSVKGFLTETDREDGTRDYERTVAVKGMTAGTRNFQVRLCGAGGCVTKTVTDRVELDD